MAASAPVLDGLVLLLAPHVPVLARRARLELQHLRRTRRPCALGRHDGDGEAEPGAHVAVFAASSCQPFVGSLLKSLSEMNAGLETIGRRPEAGISALNLPANPRRADEASCGGSKPALGGACTRRTVAPRAVAKYPFIA